jgi:chromosome segregation ATPase
MEEGLKSRFLVISVVLNIILLLSVLSLGSNSGKNWNKYQTELKTRMETEEKLANFSSERFTLEEKLKSAQTELSSNKKELAQTTRILEETLDKYKLLEEEHNKLLKLKEVLEEDLKNALMKSGSKGQSYKQPKN